MHPRRTTGFTLVEAMVVIAVLAVVAALAVSSMSRLKGTAAFANATADLVSAVQRTRVEAFSRGSNAVFVVDTVGQRWWSILDRNGDFSLTAFDPANPAPAPDQLLASATLPAAAAFGGAYGAALAAPFQGVPVTTPSANFTYCSFCRKTGTNTGYGAMTFQPGAGVVFDAGPATMGQQVTLQTTNPVGARVLSLAVIARTGTSQVFQR